MSEGEKCFMDHGQDFIFSRCKEDHLEIVQERGASSVLGMKTSLWWHWVKMEPSC